MEDGWHAITLVGSNLWLSFRDVVGQNRTEQNRNYICKDLYIYTSSYKTVDTTIYTERTFHELIAKPPSEKYVMSIYV